MGLIKELSRCRKLCACVLAILLLANMGLIFVLSSEDASTSSDRSNPIADVVVQVGEQHATANGSRPMIEEEKKDAIADMQFVVRSAAHFLEFFSLGGLACALLLTLRMSPWWRPVLASSVFGLFYAVLDELHQHFVPGRSMSVLDVSLDFGGVLCGTFGALLVVWLIGLVVRKRRNVVCS